MPAMLGLSDIEKDRQADSKRAREAPCSSFRPGKVVAPPLFGLSYTFDYFYLTSCGVCMSETL